MRFLPTFPHAGPAGLTASPRTSTPNKDDNDIATLARMRYFGFSVELIRLESTDFAGGEGGIRTPGTGLGPYNGLANRRLQPLGHLSESNKTIQFSTTCSEFAALAERARATSPVRKSTPIITSLLANVL